jgi:Reverse transcriptase (RNA-dependent DNA polymerase).
VLGRDLKPNVFVYLDDIIIVSKTFDDHLKLIQEVFGRLRDARLRLNLDKCRFCVEKLKYLGHIVDHNGIHTDPERIDAIRTLEAPTNIRGIRRFLGTVS